MKVVKNIILIGNCKMKVTKPRLIPNFFLSGCFVDLLMFEKAVAVKRIRKKCLPTQNGTTLEAAVIAMTRPAWS
jgi:hypothetical protein